MRQILTCLFVFALSCTHAQSLTIVEQDYDKALRLAQSEDKLLFIDFYTDWCGPCKELDKLVFADAETQKELSKNVVLLKYNAEKDDQFHLSKFHHILSYPTGIALTKDGKVLKRKYGFPGETKEALTKSVYEFVAASVELKKQQKTLPGYRTDVSLDEFPKVYLDRYNRVKFDSSALTSYWKSNPTPLTVGYFSTIVLFADENVPDHIVEEFLNNKSKYIEKFGKDDTEVALYFMSSGKFKKAIQAKDRGHFQDAVDFINKALSDKWVNDVLPNFEKDMLKAEGKWDVVFSFYTKDKENGELSDGHINHICYDAYRNCNDKNVLNLCSEWMKEVTDRSPKFAYLDTYAFILQKAGHTSRAKLVATKAIAKGRAEDEDVSKLEKLIN